MRIPNQRIAACAAGLLFATVAAIGFGVCREKGIIPMAVASPASPTPPSLSDDAVAKIGEDPTVKAVVGANNDLGFRLLTALDQDQGDKNTFFSPLSVSTALVMTMNGAGGDTHADMAKTLGLAGQDRSSVNRAYGELLPYLRNPDKDVQMAIANALWIGKGRSFVPSFQQASEQYFGAQTTSLDFSSPAAVGAINSWVNNNTHGKIPTLFDTLDPQTVAVLTNAIYFHGKWTEPFEKSATKPAPFHLESGGTKQVPLMYQDEHMLYFETPDFQAVSLPYGTRRMSFCVFLPTAGTPLSKLISDLDAQSWQKYREQFSDHEVQLSLPRFHADYGITLNGALAQLGMSRAFSPSQADFSPMVGSRDVWITEVVHKATLDVDEEGTTAAAATGVAVGASAVMIPPPPKVMRVDHPFFCAIVDNPTGAILFEGVIRDPE